MKKVAIGAFLLIGIAAAYFVYDQIWGSNTQTKDGAILYIPTGASFDDVLRLLDEQSILKNQRSFSILAEKMNYPKVVKPGRYRIVRGMSNRELLVMLRSGDQDEVNVTFNNITTKSDLAGVVGGYLELDSVALLRLLNDENFLLEFGYNKENVMTAFIPNTYKFFWNTNERQFFERMLHERSNFWTKKRRDKAFSKEMTEEEIFVLASIVEKEISRQDEASRIAGVYLNRLAKNMLLQADPTLKFALGDFSIKRVLNVHKEVNSPYNTYKFAGLPPGPICLPSIKTIDAVLNAESHNYLYFCASADFSGYHHFSKTLTEHLTYARKYHQALDRRNIR